MAFGTGHNKRKKHSKTGSTVMRAFHFRVEANPIEFNLIHRVFDLACELRNILACTLEDSRQAAKAAKLRGEEPVYLSAFELKKQVAGKCLEPRFLALHSQVRQELSMRVTEGQSRWFEAIKAGRRHVRPPAALARKKFRSITYPQYGTAANIHNGVLHLSKIGDFKLTGWRKMRGAKKSVTLKLKDGHFWAIVMCEVQQCDVCTPYKDLTHLSDVGVDPGLSAVLTDSLGRSYATPKPLKVAQSKLSHIQKDVSRKFEVRKAIHMKHLQGVREATGSKAPVSEGLTESLRKIPYSGRLKVNIKKLAKAHTKVARIRLDVTRKNARKMERRHARVAVEEHGLQFMLSNRRMAKATSDVAIGQQKSALQSALGAGRYFKASNRRVEGGNSQTCLCGALVPKTLKDRWHDCTGCGLQGPRDQVSAIIVQYEKFGTLPRLGVHSQVRNSKECTPGLGVLEHAVKVLETRRRESKGRGSESCAVESQASARKPRAARQGVEVGGQPRAKAVTSEPSVKRPTPRKRSMRNTTGGAQAPSVEVKTTGYAGSVGTCPVETKSVLMYGRFPVNPKGISLTEKHPCSRG